MSTTHRIYGTWEYACERAAEYANKHGGTIDRAEAFLARAGWSSSTFGVESVELADKSIDYLNAGDTYGTTVACDGHCFVTSWGDWYEETEREYCEDNGVIRCAYCGEFAPLTCDDWRAVVCGCCGYHVDGTEA